MRQVNRYLHQHGVPKDVELVRGRGYYYFVGGDTAGWSQSGVYVYHLDELTLDAWLDEYETRQKAYEKEEARWASHVAAGMFDHIDFVPPASAAKEAKRAIQWKKEHGGEVKGGTRVGWTRASQLAKRENLSPETVKRMYAFFNRHEKNKAINPKFKGEPWRDNGHVAWLIWGGDAGRKWATKVWNQMEKAEAKTASRQRKAQLEVYGMKREVFRLQLSNAMRDQIVNAVVIEGAVSVGWRTTEPQPELVEAVWHPKKLRVSVVKALEKVWYGARQGNQMVKELGQRGFSTDPGVLTMAEQAIAGRGLDIPAVTVAVEAIGGTFSGHATANYELDEATFTGKVSGSTAVVEAEVNENDLEDVVDRVLVDIEA